MILAEREHLEDLMQQQAVQLRIKEEKVLSKSFRTLSNIATYLAASAFAILRATPTYLKTMDGKIVGRMVDDGVGWGCARALHGTWPAREMEGHKTAAFVLFVYVHVCLQTGLLFSPPAAATHDRSVLERQLGQGASERLSQV